MAKEFQDQTIFVNNEGDTGRCKIEAEFNGASSLDMATQMVTELSSQGHIMTLETLTVKETWTRGTRGALIAKPGVNLKDFK